MREDWLWDRSGPPDPEIEALEKTLAPLRYRHRALPPARAPRRYWVAAAAAIAAAALLLLLPVPHAIETQWQVSSAKLRRGQVLRTGSDSLHLEAEAVGRVDLGPNSELRASTDKRLALDRGELHAYIWARPTEFVVASRAATGC